MAKVKIGFHGLSVPAQIERSRNIQTKMTGNGTYPAPNPDLTTLKNATDALELAYNDSRGYDKNKIIIMKLRRKEMLGLIRLEAAYIQQASGSDRENILSSGFDVVKRREPLPPVGQVLNLRLKGGDSTGTIRVLWDKVPGAGAYLIQICDDPDHLDNFRFGAVSLSTRFVLQGLRPGVAYRIRVAAVGWGEYGLWSAVAQKVAEF